MYRLSTVQAKALRVLEENEGKQISFVVLGSHFLRERTVPTVKGIVKKLSTNLEKLGDEAPGSILVLPSGVIYRRKLQQKNEADEVAGDYGKSPTGISYRVREDGTRSYNGYGGAFD